LVGGFGEFGLLPHWRGGFSTVLLGNLIGWCNGAARRWFADGTPRVIHPPWLGYPLAGCSVSRAGLRFAKRKHYSRAFCVQEKCMSEAFRVKMSLQQLAFPLPDHAHATENYPQSRRTFQVVRVPRRSAVGRPRRPADRSHDRAAGQWSSDLFRLRPQSAGLRPAADAAIRVRSVVGDQRAFRVCDAARGLSALRRNGRARAVGRRQVSLDEQLPLVPGPMGAAAVVERSS
jgi:hypothetical protein